MVTSLFLAAWLLAGREPQAPGLTPQAPLAEPVVSIWYRGTGGVPKPDDLAVIRAHGFTAITWPAGQAAHAAYVPGFGLLLGTERALREAARPMMHKDGTPLKVVRACRESIIAAAAPYGVIYVNAASAGRPRRGARGTLAAPIEVRVIYSRQGGHELRHARITCRLDSAGTVIALK